MPQMNPMNWAFLLISVNFSFLVLGAKLHFFSILVALPKSGDSLKKNNFFITI